MQKTESQTSNCLPSTPREVSSYNRLVTTKCWIIAHTLGSPEDERAEAFLPEQQVYTAAKRTNRGQDIGVCQLKFSSRHYWEENKATNARIGLPSTAVEAPGTPQSIALLATAFHRQHWDLRGPITHHISSPGWSTETEMTEGMPTSPGNRGHFPQWRKHHPTEIPEAPAVQAREK